MIQQQKDVLTFLHAFIISSLNSLAQLYLHKSPKVWFQLYTLYLQIVM